jgi:hypothetical protein
LTETDIRTLVATEVPEPPAGSALDYLRSVLGGDTERTPRVIPPPALSMAPPPGMPPLMRQMSVADDAPPLSSTAAPAPSAEAHRALARCRAPYHASFDPGAPERGRPSRDDRP